MGGEFCPSEILKASVVPVSVHFSDWMPCCRSEKIYNYGHSPSTANTKQLCLTFLICTTDPVCEHSLLLVNLVLYTFVQRFWKLLVPVRTVLCSTVAGFSVDMNSHNVMTSELKHSEVCANVRYWERCAIVHNNTTSSYSSPNHFVQVEAVFMLLFCFFASVQFVGLYFFVYFLLVVVCFAVSNVAVERLLQSDIVCHLGLGLLTDL